MTNQKIRPRLIDISPRRRTVFFKLLKDYQSIILLEMQSKYNECPLQVRINDLQNHGNNAGEVWRKGTSTLLVNAEIKAHYCGER